MYLHNSYLFITWEAAEEDNHLEEVNCSIGRVVLVDNRIPLAVVGAFAIRLLEVGHNLVEAVHNLLVVTHILMVAYHTHPLVVVVIHNQLEVDRTQLEVDRILVEVDHILQVADRNHPSQGVVSMDLLVRSYSIQEEDYLLAVVIVAMLATC
jgi:hypothetical protein